MERTVTPAAARERRLYMTYVEAVGRTVGHAASAEQTRDACPDEFARWRDAFIDAHGYDPADG